MSILFLFVSPLTLSSHGTEQIERNWREWGSKYELWKVQFQKQGQTVFSPNSHNRWCYVQRLYQIGIQTSGESCCDEQRSSILCDSRNDVLDRFVSLINSVAQSSLGKVGGVMVQKRGFTYRPKVPLVRVLQNSNVHSHMTIIKRRRRRSVERRRWVLRSMRIC